MHLLAVQGRARVSACSPPERVVIQAGAPAMVTSDEPHASSITPHPAAQAGGEREPNHNLPAQLTSFIGRERELAQVKAALGTTRLLTLTGVGGTGKTRLALALGSQLVAGYADGVWLVELAPLTSANHLPSSVASGLGIEEVAGQPVLTTLLSALQSRHLLLILDNCEHLVDACAHLAEMLLRSCSQVQILATSREVLGSPMEAVWQVPPLALPDPNQPSLPATAQAEAVRLFTERARQVQPDFALTEQNAAAVARLCHRLDGLPLAIELAAPRLRLLTVEQIVARLDDRFRLLTATYRTVIPRQQTLRALVDWSYALLSEREQALFSRLAVFAGGWTLEAAEAVGSGQPAEVLDLLARLVDKSLVVAETQTPTAARYRLLETLRQYAWEVLAARGEVDAIRDRHALYYLRLAEEVAPRLEEHDTALWLDYLDHELDNIRTALEWLRQRNNAAGSLRLASVLRVYWWLRSRFAEGREHIEAALALDPEGTSVAHARAFDAAGFMARFQNDHPAAERLIGESLTIWRALGDQQGLVDALSNLASIRLAKGDLNGARTLYEESLITNQAAGNQQGIADAVSHLGSIALYQGAVQEAGTLHSQSLVIWQALGDRAGVAWALYRLGDVALSEGRQAEARARYAESLMIRQTLDDQWGITETLEGFAILAAAQDQAEPALRLAGAAAAWREATGITAAPVRQSFVDRCLAPARQALSPEAREAAWQAGYAMPLHEATAAALASAPSASGPTPTTAEESSQPLAVLTPREREVVVHLAQGLTNRQIAAALAIAERTVERHVENILLKLDCHSRTQAAVWATEHGLLTAQPS